MTVAWQGSDSDFHYARYLPGGGWALPATVGLGPLMTDPSPVSSLTGRSDMFWSASGGLWHIWSLGE
jgi:hypothetical protein